ncbi:hypothetical protein WAW_02028 [Escherichia coli KTE7]|jgi:hypothetical protein|uniref:DUF2280 domain-containing protein n=1 Tax=Enterobacteriaceae TaxID=543 RepID=UPI0002A36A8E|nr:DUF2280 domain-containing protein [Escherichia coli]ELJ2672931.1 DUF2280 domain-containing protein [Citrobacter freundii]DAM17239.1 MAG TPA: protein of unknown function DUF2280 [Caudoviricetes sp.]EFG6108675.1 DUF2280 domain-containing protein [Escherichia coli]EGE2798833.1 DUF2280 domain-containing protein [Escherichia coli]ELC11389.1 hypothetical protein WCE_01104 [Escherichia coli KTE5]
MAALKPEVKAAIVQMLACYDTLSIVVDSVQKDYGIKVTPQQVESHDPTKASGKGLAQKWVELFNETRKRFQTEISDIPIANKAYRLRALDRMMTNAEKMRNMALAASLMEQAAKEVGDAYSNKQKVEHTSPDGSMTPKPTIIQLLPVEPKA